MRKGTYHYKHLVTYYPVKDFRALTIRVEVLEESATRYRVRYLGAHANGNKPGYTTWVQKTKVTVDGETPTPIQRPNARAAKQSAWLPYND